VQLIGSKREEFKRSKIKVSADLAGLSVLKELLKELTLLTEEHLLTLLNSTSSHATTKEFSPSKTWDAQEVR